MYWLIKTINTPFKLHVALSHIRDALSLIRDDVSSKQEIKQASKQEDRFHCWPPMVGLAKARPNKWLALHWVVNWLTCLLRHLWDDCYGYLSDQYCMEWSKAHMTSTQLQKAYPTWNKVTQSADTPHDCIPHPVTESTQSSRPVVTSHT